jgi:hypothetical protein
MKGKANTKPPAEPPAKPAAMPAAMAPPAAAAAAESVAAVGSVPAVPQSLGSAASSVVAAIGADFEFQAGDPYNFNDSFTNLSEKGSAPGSQKAQHHDTSASSTCRTCELPKAKGFSYCLAHKQAFQALERQCRKTDPKTKLHMNVAQGEAFDSIFGKGRDGPPNMALANKVILEFEARCPSSNSSSGPKCTTKRAAMDLTRFVHTKGSIQEKLTLSDLPMWDEELFVSQMELLRKWSAKYAAQIWQKLHNVPGADNDVGGPGGSARTRIPANLVGADKIRNSSGEYEKRELEHSTKTQKGLGAEAIENMQAQTARGFSHLGADSSGSAQWHAAVEAGSSVARPGSAGIEDIRDIMMGAASQL